MEEQLTRRGISSHTRSMAENDVENIQGRADADSRNQRKVESPEEREEREELEALEKERRKKVVEEAEEVEKSVDPVDAEIEKQIVDVPEDKKGFYRNLWKKLYASWEEGKATDEIEELSLLDRISSPDKITDLLSLRNFVSPGGPFYKQYQNIFNTYARQFEGSYRDEFGRGNNFSGSSTDLLYEAQKEYLASVKRIMEKYRDNGNVYEVRSKLWQMIHDVNQREAEVLIARQKNEAHDTREEQEVKDRARKERDAEQAKNSKSPEYPDDGKQYSAEDLLRMIAKNTGMTVEELRQIKTKLDTMIDLTEENWKTLLRIERYNQHYLRYFVESLNKVDWEKDNYLEEADKITAEQENMSYAQLQKQQINGAVERATTTADLLNMVGSNGAFQQYHARVTKAYAELEGQYGKRGEVFGRDGELNISRDEFMQLADSKYREVKNEVERRINRGESVREVKQFLNSILPDYNEMLSQAEEAVLKMSVPAGAERGGRRGQVEDIETLAEAIMDTHPEFARGTPNELLDPEGNLRQDNFIKWIQSQLTYYHNQDPDNPQVNFFSQINIDIPELLRTVNVFTMLNNPGRYFRDRNGVELTGLKNAVTDHVWLYGDLRNKDIAYRLSMPLDERIGEVLANMYQNNVLTKSSTEGKPPIYWIFNMAENYGTGDRKVGQAIVEYLLMYYNLTDFEELYHDFAGPNSPLFHFDEIKNTVKELIVAQKRKDTDSYFSSEEWAWISRWFDASGNFRYTGNEKGDIEKQIEFVKFFNIFQPEQKNYIIDYVRAQLKKTVANRIGISSASNDFAEQFAHFFLRFTLAGARADIGAPAMDAGEKGVRRYLMEKGPNATNPGYANAKSIGLRGAYGVDFFAGTYTLSEIRKDHIVREVTKEKQIVKRGDSVQEFGKPKIKYADGQERDLGDKEEVWVLTGGQQVASENGREVIKERTMYTDLQREAKPFKKVDIRGTAEARNRQLFEWDDTTHKWKDTPAWDEAAIIRDLSQQFSDPNIEIITILDEHKLGGQEPGYDEQGRETTDSQGRHTLMAKKGFQVNVEVIVRQWNLDNYVKGAQHKRVVVRRENGQYVIVEQLDDANTAHGKGTVVIGTEKSKGGEEKDITLKNFSDGGNPLNEQVVIQRRVYYERERGLIEYVILQSEDEYDESNHRIIRNGNVVRQFTAEQVDKNNGLGFKAPKYIAQRIPHQKSTLSVMQEMHVETMRNQVALRLKDEEGDSEEVKRLKNEERKRAQEAYDKAATQLQYKSDTMRQYASNLLGRMFQLFHEGNQKHLFDLSSILKGWDERKHMWVFDEAKIQEIFTEQLYKRRRYLIRTYAIDQSEIIRGISWDPQWESEKFESMTMAESLFGPAVISSFRQSNGEIDFEFLSTQRGIGELFKTELIMRMAAEEAQLADLHYPEPHLKLQTKLAFRQALRNGIANAQHLDLGDPSLNHYELNSFEGRQISLDPNENKEALDYMDLYDRFTGKTERQLITDSIKREVGLSFLAGIGEAVGVFAKKVTSG